MMDVEGNKELFLIQKRARVARTIYSLCKSQYQECYASKIFQYLPDITSMHTVHDAIQLFEECGWIEREDRNGRTKPIALTEEGDKIFSELVNLLEVLGW